MGVGTTGYLRTSETEEELQLRLKQLLNLPVQTDAPATPGLMENMNDYSVLGSKMDLQYITLDCHALADSLSCLPVHKRLDINADLLELGGYLDDVSGKRDLLTREENFEHVVAKQNKDVSSHGQDATVTHGTRDKVIGYNFQFSSAQHPQTAAGKSPDHSQIQHSICESPKTVTQNVDLHDVGEDTELDQLLQESTTTTIDGKLSTIVIKHPSSAPSQPMHTHKIETDELDDMLDELLLA